MFAQCRYAPSLRHCRLLSPRSWQTSLLQRQVEHLAGLGVLWIDPQRLPKPGNGFIQSSARRQCHAQIDMPNRMAGIEPHRRREGLDRGIELPQAPMR